jgi:hypothetical protein
LEAAGRYERWQRKEIVRELVALGKEAVHYVSIKPVAKALLSRLK